MALRLKRRKRTDKRRYAEIAARVEAFTKMEIFERDHWTCGLCRKPVDQSLAYPHRLSKSLDHIVPLNQGGEHSRRNVQLTHLICNLKKPKRGLFQARLLE